MSTNVEQGDRAIVIGGTDGLNIGKIVRVGQYLGDHSTLGVIWHCLSLGEPIVTEYGAIGMEADFADRWLRKLPPTTTLQASNEKLYQPSALDHEREETDQGFAKAA